MKFSEITREQFVNTPRLEDDSFARTFISKADTQGLWPTVVGYVQPDDTVCSAISYRLGKRHTPKVVNLALLHTFALYRRRGLARRLVLSGYQRAWTAGATYFRVSSEEDAVAFYRALGFRFWGRQKSGCFLCMHRMVSADPRSARYIRDAVITAALNSGRRGSLVEHFEEAL